MFLMVVSSFPVGQALGRRLVRLIFATPTETLEYFWVVAACPPRFAAIVLPGFPDFRQHIQVRRLLRRACGRPRYAGRFSLAAQVLVSIPVLI